MLVDAGNVLFDRALHQTGRSQESIIADGIAQAYARMGYDAVAVGPFDLSAGLEFLTQLQSAGSSWLSANIYDSENKLVFNPYKTIHLGGLKAALIGLTGKPLENSSEYSVTDGKNALKELLPALTSTHDLIILLSSLSYSALYDIIQEFPEINIIVGADRRKANVQAQLINNTLFTQTADQGKYLGLLSVYWKSSPWEKDGGEDLGFLKKRLSSINSQLKQMHRSTNKTTEPYTRKMALLEKNRQKVIADIANIEGGKAADQAQDAGSRYTSLIISLKPSLSEDSGIKKLIESTKDKLNRFNQQETSAAESRTPSVASSLSLFAGSDACLDCHGTQTEFWQKTTHSRAYKTLVKNKQAFNLDCLPCHVTHDRFQIAAGADRRKALLSIPESLRNVGCEVCHGSARAHIMDPVRQKPVKRAGKNVCLYCHTPERDKTFNYSKDIMLISCPA